MTPAESPNNTNWLDILSYDIKSDEASAISDGKVLSIYCWIISAVESGLSEPGVSGTG